MCQPAFKTDILDWWLTKYLPPIEDNQREITDRAIKYGRLKPLRWLEQKRVLSIPKGRRVHCNDAEITYWLHELGFELSINLGNEIQRSNLEFLKWAHEHNNHIIHGISTGIASTDDALRIAASTG